MKTLLLIISTLTLLFLTACASGASVPDDDVTRKSPEQRLYEARLVLTDLKDAPDAALVSRELDRASVWIGRAELILSQPEHDPERVTLLLDTIEGQLVQVRAFYSAKDSTDALERTRGRYEDRMSTIEAARRANDAKLSTPSTKETP